MAAGEVVIGSSWAGNGGKEAVVDVVQEGARVASGGFGAHKITVDSLDTRSDIVAVGTVPLNLMAVVTARTNLAGLVRGGAEGS